LAVPNLAAAAVGSPFDESRLVELLGAQAGQDAIHLALNISLRPGPDERGAQ
jgi:hypothetical protein